MRRTVGQTTRGRALPNPASVSRCERALCPTREAMLPRTLNAGHGHETTGPLLPLAYITAAFSPSAWVRYRGVLPLSKSGGSTRSLRFLFGQYQQATTG